jgi:uncharacterized protein YecE (DUF72 family)
MFVGTAGWSIPREHEEQFPIRGTALERYASRLAVTEINSSFHRAHRLSTWQRWADSVPDEFRFSVKLPKHVTHQRKLAGCSGELDHFLEQAAVLGGKLAVLLVQLPPKLRFDEPLASNFFTDLRARTAANIACEPRHDSWFTPQVSELLEKLRIARVAADPAICEAAAMPGGWRGLSYLRLHGSPVKYRCSYEDRINDYAAQLKGSAAASAQSWCIFDNTASSAATGDALALMNALAGR